MSKKHVYEIKNLANGNELYFFGEVGWDITAAQVMADLEPLKGQPLKILINSPGGSFFEGVTLYNWLRSNFQNLETEVLGYAASAASVVFLAGKTRTMNPAAFVMIHSVSVWMSGTAEDLRKEADVLDKLNEALIQIYVKNSTMSEEQVRAYLAEDTWFNAEESVANGLATAIREDAPAVAASFDLEAIGKYKNLPAALKSKITNLSQNNGGSPEGDQTNMLPNQTAGAPAATPPTGEPQNAGAALLPPTSPPAADPQNHAEELTAQRVGFQNAAQMSDIQAAAGGYHKPGEKNWDAMRVREVMNVITQSGLTPSMTEEFLAVLNKGNPLRALSKVITIDGSGKIQVSGGVSGAWGAEGATPSDGTPSYTPITLDAFDFNGRAVVSDEQMEMDWGNFKATLYEDIANYITNNEATAMLGAGAGSDRPQGIFNATATTTTAANTGFTAAELIAFLDGIPTGLSDVVAFMSPSTLSKIAALTDATKQIDLDRINKTVNGVKYISDDRCPAWGANTKVIAVANWKRSYYVGVRRNRVGSLVRVKEVPGSTEMVTNVLFNYKCDGRLVDTTNLKVLAIKV